MSDTPIDNEAQVVEAPAMAAFAPPANAPVIPLSSIRGGISVWGMVGISEGLRKLHERIRAAASSELSVLIIGDTGSGKELVANAIHQESRRSSKRFVAVNTGAIPRELVSSELFGHLKGSFTGAVCDRDGKFVDANGGTLFLDELGTMDERTQVGLLRALEQRVIQPVGGNKEIPVNVRIVAATNTNLINEVKAGHFREDLYYRLESFIIHVPPLRQRKEDIPSLVAHFAEKLAREDGRPIEGFTAQALHDLCRYEWPGNVRELRNAVSQAVILSPNGVIDSCHLPEKLTSGNVEKQVLISAPPPPQPVVTPPPVMDSIPITLPRADGVLPRPRTIQGASVVVSLHDGLDKMVEQIMQRALEACNGNVTRAAQVLKISRKTIYNRLRVDEVIRDRTIV